MSQSCYGTSGNIVVFFRLAGVVPIIKLGGIPSTGSASRAFGNMLGSETVSTAKCGSEAESKAFNPNSIKFMSNLLKSKNIPFPANLTLKNFKGFRCNNSFFAVIINANSDDRNGELSKDMNLIKNWHDKYKRQENSRAPLEKMVVNIEEYSPSMASNGAPQSAPGPVSAPGSSVPVTNNVVGGRSRRRKNFKKNKQSARGATTNVTRNNKKRKTANRRKSVKRHH